MNKILHELQNDQLGQGLAEYALIISLVILAVIVALETFGIRLGNLFEYIDSQTSEVL